MDSLDAQCLIMQLIANEIPPPDLWRHDRSGSLSCAYSGGEQTFTWRVEDVAEMARTWRSQPREAPEELRLFLDAHQRLEGVASEAGLGLPDTVVHDLSRREVRGVWEHEKLVVAVDEIGDVVRAEA